LNNAKQDASKDQEAVCLFRGMMVKTQKAPRQSACSQKKTWTNAQKVENFKLDTIGKPTQTSN
jgi:hypothetical protein